MRARRPTRVILGGGVGVLYASTTISGPPLALMLNNQGLSAGEFRGSIAFIRVAESALTAAAYLSAGLFSATSAALVPPMLLGVVAGVPIGAFATHRIEPETFRRVAMAFDAFIVACGLSRTLVELRIASTSTASGLVVLVALIVVALLMAFFRAEPLVSKGVRL